MRRVSIVVCVLYLTIPTVSHGQDATNFTNFFINPYSLNPSYAGIEGKKAFFLTYRKQWSGIEGSPTVISFSHHAPINTKLNYGVNITNDTRGIVKNTGLQLSVAYALVLDRHKFIRFGLSAGAASNAVDVSDLEATDPLLSDPAIMSMQENNISLLGSAGISFHLKAFHMGVSMPNIFSPAYVSEDAFTISEVKPFQSIISHASYRIYFGKDKHVFEPYFLYRVNTGLPSQYEAAGILHLNHKIWVGGSYKQDFGISALGGLKVNEILAIGGSYSLANSGVNELNSPTYEIHLSYLAGNKKKNAEVYSFVSTVKEKERKTQHKSASEVIAEKRKQQELDKKKQDEALAKQKKEEEQAKELARKEEEKKAAEALALQQAAQKKPDTQPVDPAKRHDGGPRLKSEVLTLDLPVYDTAHHQEQERISKLTEHAGDPNEVHGADNTAHPNAERHEFVKRGGHQEELEVAEYVISGVFKSDTNAKHFADGLKKMGFTADFGHLTERNLWYVYIAQTADINAARAERDKYRQLKIFKDAWLLTVHH